MRPLSGRPFSRATVEERLRPCDQVLPVPHVRAALCAAASFTWGTLKEFDDKAADAANLEAANVKKAEMEANGEKFETDEPVVIDASEMVSTTDPGWAGKRGAAAYRGAKAFVTKGANFDVHESVEHDATVQAIHENAEKFDPMAEAVFRYIQIFTAICDSFAHGANDTANAMGPFMAIYVIYDTGKVSSKADVGDDAYWILAIGGAGIGIGLLLCKRFLPIGHLLPSLFLP
eukprot:1992223-Pleurochrysis_carterae.AAC.1